jgi:GNAT superfamily N-acetyltransferase
VRIPNIILTNAPGERDREAILDGLRAYNKSKAGDSGHALFAALLHDPESGDTVGGLWGRFGFDWLFVELLFVPESLRGNDIGSRLMREAEAAAAKRGCVGVRLDTFGFQARGFYEKLGYEVFGVLDDHPRGSQRFFLRKLVTNRI